MAWNDETLNARRGPVRRAISLDPIEGILDDSAQSYANEASSSTGRVRSTISERTTGAATDFEPAEFAMNSQTGEIALPNGQVIKANAPTILQLATLQSQDGTPLPRMRAVPEGFRPISQAEMKRIVDAIPTESDFWGEAFANGKTTLGLMASAVDSMFGSDDPNNSWSNAARELGDNQSIGQLKASQGRWYSSFDSFLNSLGQTAGNVGGTVIGAVPVAATAAGAGALSGAGVGAIPGGLLGAGLAASGGAAAFGEQATDFYTNSLDAMQKMSPGELERESPLYREVARENPGMPYEEAIQEVAIRGARVAGTTAGLLGAAEGVVGGRLAGNLLARIGVTKSLLGPAMDAVAKRTGVAATTGRVAGRAALGGTGAAAEEMAESMLGQAAGAAYTGVGSRDPMSYASADEGWDAALGGALFGAFGGRSRSPAEVAQTSALGEALRSTPELQNEWSSSPRMSQEQDLVPAYMRRQGQAAQNQARQMAMQPPPAEQRAMIEQQINNVLAERFGPNWFDNIDQVAQDPGGRQLVGQLIALQQDARAEMEQPAYQRGYAQQPVDPGQPSLQGPAFGDQPGQQGYLAGIGAPQPMPQEQQIQDAEFSDPNQMSLLPPPGPQELQASEPQGAAPPPNLRERRAFQSIRQREAQAASEANPQALGQSPSRAIEQEIFDAEDQIEQIQQQLDQRPARDPRKKFLREELKRQKARLDDAEVRWQAAQQEEQATAPEVSEPAAAPQELAPSGDRPMGVAPPPLPNPEPMSEAEAASRQKTQQKRAAARGEFEQAAQVSDQGVSPTTPEPAEDIAAQIEAMNDPQSGRDAVFVAAGNESAIPAKAMPGVRRVSRPGVGTLLTTNMQKAREFRTKRLNDAAIQKLVGYSENKADALRSGEAPVVVQARTKRGVAAEQLASRKGVPAAREAVARLAPKGAKVVETSAAAAQAERARPGRAAVVATSKEKTTPAKKSLKRKAKDDDDSTRADRALAQTRAPRTSEAPAASAPDTIERASTRKAETVTLKGKATPLPERMTRRTGSRGVEIDLRVDSIDEDARLAVGRLLDNSTLSAADRTKVEAAMRDFDQLDTMMDAAVTAAEERLRKVIEAAPDGTEFTREAERRQLEVERAAVSGERGRPRQKPRTSPLAYLPLVLSESRGFLKALRAEAKSELKAGYQPAQSTARQMISGISPRWDEALENDTNGRKVLQVFAGMDDAAIEAVLQSTHQLIQDSTVAKQVMRGATEVAHAIRRMEQDTVGSRNIPQFANHELPGVENKKLPHSTEHGALPDGVRGVVDGWVRQFEKGGNKFSAPVHVMSMQDAMQLEPGAFAGRRAPNGKFIRRTDETGKTTDYILAVDWNRFKFEGAALEVLAHEYGHMVTTELYARTDPRTRRAINTAYENWLRTQNGRSVDDILRDQMPGVERLTFQGGALETDRAYATDFWEWAARNAALYLLDPNRPHIGVVEKFFKRIADALRAIYEKVVGPRVNQEWADSLDRWVQGTMTVRPMPDMPASRFDHEEFNGASEPEQRATTNMLARQATQAMAPLRTLMSSKATKEDINAALQPVLEGKQSDLIKRLGLSLTTMRQMERKYRDTPLGPALSGWVRNQQLKAKTANNAMEAGSQWMERANQLDARVRATLEQVMYQATHFGVNPEVPINDAKNAHLLRGSSYVRDVNERRYRGVRDLYEAAVKADARVADIYAGLRDAFQDLHKKTLEKQLEIVEASDFSEKAKEQIVERIKAAQAELRNGPYFPLMRFGNWIVKVQLPSFTVGKGGKVDASGFDTKTAAREEMRNQRALNPGAQVTVEKTEDGYMVRVYQRGVYFFESEAQAKAASKDIEREVRENYEAQGVNYDDALAAMEPVDDGDGDGASSAIISQPFKGREGFEQTKAGSPEFMQEVNNLVAQNKLDPEVAATLQRLAIEALPENNYRHSLLPRQNIFGASKQMLRAYGHRYQGAAHYYSNVEHGAQINKNWAKAWQVNREYAPAGRVLNMLAANQKAIADRMAPTMANTVMNTITDASSLYSLGFSPAYVLTNSLQPWTVTMPTLAGMTTRGGSSVGIPKAAKYLRAAYEGAIPFFTKRGMADFVNEIKAMSGTRATTATLQDTAKEIITKFGKTDGERRMLESLLERGTLDFSWLNSLEDAMRGGVIGHKWANLQRLGMAFPQQVEAMNRVTTALAGYRLAKDERLTDGSEAALQEFADDLVAETQLDYSRMNRPLAFNKAGLNVILQFKLYMQGMYMLFMRHIAMAMRGATPEERKQGRRTVTYLLAAHAAAAGAAGLGPVAGMAKLALVLFASASPDKDDDWKSGEQLLREMLKDVFGEYGGTVAEKGLPAVLGVDMSDRIGIPVLIDQRFANIRESDTAGTTMDKWLLYSLGAPYSNAKRVVQGVSAAADGDFANAVNGLPAAARAVARSAKWAKEGIVDKDGDTFIPRSELDWGDLAINTLGLAPLKTSQSYAERTEVKQTTSRIVNERKRLMQEARTGNDVSEEIAAFNASVPKVFRITGQQLRKSAEAKADRDRGEERKEEAAVRKLLDK